MEISVFIFTFCLFLVPLVVFVPKRFKSFYSFANVAITSLLTTYVIVTEFFKHSYYFEEIVKLPILGNIEIKIDPLSAIFILMINFIFIMASIYSIGYLKKQNNDKSLNINFIAFNILQISMLLISMIQEFIPFLIMWEVMSFASFLLILADYEKSKTVKVALNYLVQMHVGVVFLMCAVIILQNETGDMTFRALNSYFSGHSNFPMFLLFFIGFGFKLGFLPMHTWVGDTYSVVPSHVAAVMSGVMKKLGVYGLIRVLVAVQADFLQIGLFLLVMSLITGVYGIISAIMQKNIRRSLAYSSMENIGIIGIGLGMGVIGRGVGDYALAFLGYSGALLHVFNHSLFKSLLFFSAGSIDVATGTVNINKLGGIFKKMKITGVIFLIGSLAVCGLPPLNGFMSEFLLYSGILEGMNATHLMSEIGLLIGLLALSLIGGLAIYNFTKVFGLTFLGTPRTQAAENAQEVNFYMLLPQILLIITIFSVGFFPKLYIDFIGKVVSHLVHQAPIFTVKFFNAAENISLMGMVFCGIAVTIYFLRTYIVKKNGITEGPTWGCGYVAPNERMQYSATSYAHYFQTIASPLMQINQKYTPIESNDIFPTNRPFKTEISDKIRTNWLEKPINLIVKIIKKFAFIQSGHTQSYLIYAILFIAVLFIITFFKFI
jgi:formate hydrogenlyase subunit 3/multisubunit Na+/H+ antiporter MnhD subunit